MMEHYFESMRRRWRALDGPHHSGMDRDMIVSYTTNLQLLLNTHRSERLEWRVKTGFS